MMKKHLLLTLSLLLALSGPARAIVVEILGDGNMETHSCLPTYTNYNYSLSQQIYTAAKIGKKGNITGITFYITNGAHTRNLSIYMAHTDKASFTDEADWVPIDEHNCVFSGDVDFIDEQWTTIEFDTPFDYDGSSNLLIAVDDNTGTWQYSLARVFPTEEGMSHSTYSDFADIALEPRTNWNIYKVKNQIKLDFDKNSYPRPTNVTVSNIATTTATFARTPNGEETEWDIMLTDVETDNITTKHAKTNPYTIAGLDIGTTYTV